MPATTSPVAGSNRVTVLSDQFVSQTPPFPAATAGASSWRGAVANLPTTMFVAGSILTSPSGCSVTQTDPSPAATFAGFTPSGILATIVPAGGRGAGLCTGLGL